MASCNECVCSEVCYYKSFNDVRVLKKRRNDVEKICKSFVHRDRVKVVEIDQLKTTPDGMTKLTELLEAEKPTVEDCRSEYYRGYNNGIVMAQAIVLKQNVVPVVYAKWKQSEPGYRLCGHCMADVAIYSAHKNYCPNCGAKMDGDGNGTA